MRTKVFFDTEFTGLHQNTTLISIGLVSDCGKTFYAETNDYDELQLDDWLNDNVIANLHYKGNHNAFISPEEGSIGMKNSKGAIGLLLKKWLLQFPLVEMWSDCLAYDWVLFNDLFGHAFNTPNNVYYIPFDICTLMLLKGVDPDISREEFGDSIAPNAIKHNALWDAQMIKNCYEKLIKM
jgi:hypothetical protein